MPMMLPLWSAESKMAGWAPGTKDAGRHRDAVSFGGFVRWRRISLPSDQRIHRATSEKTGIVRTPEKHLTVFRPACAVLGWGECSDGLATGDGHQDSFNRDFQPMAHDPAFQ